MEGESWAFRNSCIVRAESMTCRLAEPAPRHRQGTLQDYAAYATGIGTFTKVRESIKREVA